MTSAAPRAGPCPPARPHSPAARRRYLAAALGEEDGVLQPHVEAGQRRLALPRQLGGAAPQHPGAELQRKGGGGGQWRVGPRAGGGGGRARTCRAQLSRWHWNTMAAARAGQSPPLAPATSGRDGTGSEKGHNSPAATATLPVGGS